jgi:hypothetical protein
MRLKSPILRLRRILQLRFGFGHANFHQVHRFVQDALRFWKKQSQAINVL